MAEREQVTPLAQAGEQRSNSPDQENPSASPTQVTKKSKRRRRWIRCCGISCVLLLVLVVVIVILAFTVFRVRDPTMKLNSITIDGWSNVMWTNLRPGMNLTIIADVSVKNPNAASFKFKNATTSVSYDQIVIGEVYTPSGNARARRTMGLSARIEAMMERIIGVPRLGNHLRLGVLPINTYTRMSGKVKILGISKSVGVRMRCDMSLNINNQDIQDLSCTNKFSL